MADLPDKLRALFDLIPGVKDKADTTEAALLALGLTPKDASRFLVSGTEGDHLPIRDENGKPDHHLMGAAWAALHEGYRGNKYEGPNKSEALSKLVALYKSENMDTPSGSAEKKEMDTEMKQKDDKEELKEGEKGASSPEEEKQEGEKPVAKKEFDVVELTTTLNATLEATRKETAELKDMIAATSKETQELKVTLAQGFEAVAKGMELRDATIKDLQTKLEGESAKVKELAGEVPNAVYQASMQNMFARIANGDLAPAIKQEAPVQNPTVPNTQNVDPILSFLQQANQGIGLAPQMPQNLPS